MPQGVGVRVPERPLTSAWSLELSVEINLKNDALRISKYIAKRCEEYSVYVNAGPGRDEDPIRQVTLGFGIDQAGWVVLVFDTRPDAQFDGEWQGFIEQNEESFPDWTKALDQMLEGESLEVTPLKGRKKIFTGDNEFEEVAAPFGEMCRDLLMSSRKIGLFDKLPLAADCRLSVEEHEGNYGWDDRPAAPAKQTADSIFRSWEQTTKKLPQPQQIDFWLKQLDQLAKQKVYGYAMDSDLCDAILKELSRKPKVTTQPLLKWTHRWARKPEFKSHELKKGEDNSFPHQHVLCKVFWAVDKWGEATPEAEKLIRKFIQTATRLEPVVIQYHNSKSTLRPKGHHGISPWHAARLLRCRFTGYPEPQVDQHTNELLHREAFCDVKPSKSQPKS